jgi:Rad3-related DNA helicase
MAINRKTVEGYVLEWTNKKIGNDFKFREHQFEAIVDIIVNILEDGNKNYVVEAPTGSGKSLINIISAGVLAEYFDLTSYILVSDLFLWEQYDKFIQQHKEMNFASIKGQTGNYTCLLNKEDMRNADCKMAGLSWASMFNKSTIEKYGYTCAYRCEYVKARKKAITSKVCLMTYQLFLFIMNNQSFNTDSHGAPIFSSHDILFCDECHNIPEIVQNQYSPIIKRDDFQKLNELYDYAYGNNMNDLFEENSEYELIIKYSRDALNIELEKIWAQFIKQDSIKKDDVDAMIHYLNILKYFPEVCEAITSTISSRKANKLPISKDDIRLFKLCTWFQNYGCFWSDFNQAISEAGEDYLLKDITVVNADGDIHVSFKCTKEDFIVYKYLLSQVKYKIMLSATVGGKEAYDDNMGFKYTEDKESDYHVIPSNFDFTKSPIHFLNKFKMSFREKELSFVHLKKIIYSICETKFANERGMIQTGSYAFAKELYNSAPYNIKQRMLLYNGSREKTTCIKIHEISDNTILVGPSLNEGIDLPGDKCRFIIIMKVPYPSLADRLVKEKLKLFPLWYNSTTSNEIIQGIGRGVRFNGDWCVSYILDACFWKLYLETQDQYSEEFKKRLNII